MSTPLKLATQTANLKAAIEDNIGKKLSDTTLIFIAIAAFALGSFIYTGFNFLHPTKYRDWSINIKDASVEALTKSRKTDSLQVAAWQTTIDSMKKAKFAPDSIRKYSQWSDSLQKRMNLLDAAIFNVETNWSYSKAVVPNAFKNNVLFKEDHTLEQSTVTGESFPFYYQLTDTDKTASPIRVKATLSSFESRDHKTNIDFFSKYPTTGFYAILSITQFVFWVIIGCISVSLLTNLIADMKGKGIGIGTATLWQAGAATGITIIAFLLVFFLFIYDGRYDFDALFMRGFTLAMWLSGTVGYIAAGVLLLSFILTAYYVQQATLKYAAALESRAAREGEIKAITKELEAKVKAISELGGNAPDIKTLLPPEPPGSISDLELAILREQQKLCTRYFNFFFAMAAVLLSVFVLWVGTLFSSINSLELFSFYHAFTGHAFLPYDFVYLYGALHTLLLFIFYIPVKLRLLSIGFNSLEEQPASGEVPGTLKKILVRFVEILAASSPLLTAVLQKALE